MKRRTRFLASLVALFAIAFAQVAIAAHACERMDAQRVAAAGEEHGCCPDKGITAQCAEHCRFGFASVDSARPLPVFVVTGPLLAVLEPVPASTTPQRCAFESPAPGPPPPLLFIALRI